MTGTSKLCICACMCPRVCIAIPQNVNVRLAFQDSLFANSSACCMSNYLRNSQKEIVETEVKQNLNLFLFSIPALSLPLSTSFIFLLLKSEFLVFYFYSQMEDIDAMFSHLLGEMDHLSQVSLESTAMLTLLRPQNNRHHIKMLTMTMLT